jgi:hypothetical protein
MKPLIARFGTKTRQTLDMEGFPTDREVENLEVVEIIEDYNEKQLLEAAKLSMRYVPVDKVSVYADMRMTASQINKALIKFYNEKYVREELWSR